MKVLIASRTLSHSPILWLARFGWLAIFALVISLLVVNSPWNVYFTEIEYGVKQSRAAIEYFTTLQTFAGWLTAARWVSLGVYFSVALLIAWHKQDDWFALAVSAALLILSWGFLMRGDESTWFYPVLLRPLLPALHVVLGQSSMLSLIMLFFLFPDGRFVTRGHNWMAALAVGATVLFFVADQYPQAKPSTWPALDLLLEQYTWGVWFLLLFISLLAALVGQIYRYRRLATPIQRQQMKWVLIGLAAILGGPLFSMPLEEAGGVWGSLASLGVELAVETFLPITIGFSILRYRLWDVDLIINRTLVYGTLTGVILALYGLSVGLASTLFPAQNRWLLSGMALGVVVLLAAQFRPRLQAVADRWLPVPPPAMLLDEAMDERGQERPALRLARAAWLLVFAFLLWQFVAHFATVGDVLAAIRSEWIVQTSLPALPGVSATAFSRYLLLLRLVVFAIFWGMAVLIFRRQRHDAMALFVAFFLLLAPNSFVLSGDESWLEERLFLPVIGMAVLLPFLFPDGRFIPRSARWRGVLFAAVLTTPLLAYPLVSLSRPDSQPDERAYGSFIFTIAVAMTAGLVSQVYRYRVVATATQRQQTKWVLLGLGVVLLWLLWGILWSVGALSMLGVSEPLIALIVLQLSVCALAALPVTIAISILRYRLWDIDLLINRSLVFGALTLLVAAGYVVLVGVFGVLFQTGNSLLFSILATGLIAILFHPLRQRLQKIVNQLLYGDRDDPATVLSRLGERLAQTAVPDEILPVLVETIAQALKLPYVAVLQEEGEIQGEEIIIEYGQPSHAATSFPLKYQGRSVGKLIVAERAPAESFTPAERRLLENIVQQAGAAVYAAQLTHHLQQSRQQLIASREEERRRIRRDLHDGLGPQLATMGLKLDAISNYLTSDRESIAPMLQELKSQVQDAIQDIRRLVYDLRPPALDQLGLLQALREFAAQNSANGLHIRIESPETLPPLPAAVEVAAYRIALEALTNTVRHANASRCTLRIELSEALCLEIIDNGVGLPAELPSGVGLASIRERTAELGGTFSLQSKPAAGTHLSIRLHIT